MNKSPTHRQLIKAIKNLITEHGGYVVKIYNGGPFGQKGISDFIGVWKGQGIAIEVVGLWTILPGEPYIRLYV